MEKSRKFTAVVLIRGTGTIPLGLTFALHLKLFLHLMGFTI